MNALTIKALALLSRQAVIDVELLETITEILRQGIWKAEAESAMAYFVNVLHMSEDSVVRRCKAADLLDRYPLIVRPMLEAREIHLTGLSMLHAVVNDNNAETLLNEARGKSKKTIEAICCRIQPKPTLQPYVRRIATNDDGAPVREFTHVARFLLTDETKERLDEALNLVSDTDLNAIMARALRLFVERTLITKRRMLKRTAGRDRQTQDITSQTGRAARAAEQTHVEREGGGEMPEGYDDALGGNGVMPDGRDDIPEGHGDLPEGNGKADAPDAIEHLADDTLVPVGPKTHTRYVTAKVCRAVYVRDKRRCQFDLANGSKCHSTKNPQLHHKQNHAWGGEATEENLTVFCRVHNLYQAELDFGPWTRTGADPRDSQPQSTSTAVR